MKKAAIISVTFLLMISLFFVSGCEDLTGSGDSDTRDATLSANKGLDATFLQNSPPSELFPNNPFEIDLDVENKGQYDIQANKIIVILAGLNSNLFNLEPDNVTIGEDLVGVKSYGESIIPGGVARAKFLSNKGYTGPLGGDSPFTAIAKICYEYESLASTTVCVKSLSLAEGAVCDITSPKTVISSGAPVKIVKIEELPLGQPSPTEVTLGFNLYIENVADGKPFRSDLDACSSIDYKDLDVVSIKSVQIDNIDFSIEKCDENLDQTSCCWFNQEAPHVQIYNGEGKVLCQITTNSSVTYSGVLQATLSYNYADQISKSFTVRKIGV